MVVTNIEARTFDWWIVNESLSPLAAINKAVMYSAENKVPVYGTGTYAITRSVDTDQIILRNDATVVCLPGCTFDVSSGSATSSFVTNTSTISNASWIGGHLKGAGTTAIVGDVFSLTGNNLRLEGITVSQFKSGAAFVLLGDFIQLVDAHIVGKTGILYEVGSKGIWLKRGDGFVCQDAMVDVEDDGLMLVPGQQSYAITDARVLGINVASASGRAVVVETVAGANKDMTRIRLDGLTAKGGAKKEVVSIRNAGPLALTDVVVRDAFLDCQQPTNAGSVAPAAVVIANGAGTSNGTMGGIALNNLVIRSQQTGTYSGDALQVSASSSNGIDGLSWTGGGVGFVPPAGGTPTYNRRYVVLSNARNCFLKALGFDQSQHASPILVGDTAECQNVVFSDIGMTRVAANATALKFNLADRCGWVRGAISGAAGTPPAPFVTFTAVELAAMAKGCFVEGADLSGNASAEPVVVTTASGYRLTGNAGSVKRSAIGLGTPVDTSIVAGPNGGTITPQSGLTALAPNNAVLRQIDTGNSQPGDLLILTARSNVAKVTVGEPTGSPSFGNLALSTAAIDLVGAAGDTLTLMYRGKNSNGNDLGWIQVALSKNG